MIAPESPNDIEFKANLLEIIPSMRAFARSLTGNREIADDLIQDALVKAWCARETFATGTNLKAWVYTILRNQFFSDKRRSWRQASLDEDDAHQLPAAGAEQDWAIELSYVAWALKSLPYDQREALILTGVGGFSYEEVTRICNCAEGTVKSRVARGRKKLQSILESNATIAEGVRGRAQDAANEIIDQLAALSSPDGSRREREKESRRLGALVA